MILRRVIAHVRCQEWTAMALDFVIGAMGLFISLQALAPATTKSCGQLYRMLCPGRLLV